MASRLKTTSANRRVCVIIGSIYKSDCMSCTPEQAIGQSINLTINSAPYTFFIEGVYHYDDSNSLMMDYASSGDTVTAMYIPFDGTKDLRQLRRIPKPYRCMLRRYRRCGIFKGHQGVFPNVLHAQ